MNKLMKQIGVVGLALATTLGAVSPSFAMPLGNLGTAAQPVSSDVVNVQFYGDRGYGGRGDPDARRGGYGGSYEGRDYRRGGYGYRAPEPPRRKSRDSDILIPLGALAAGAIIGGVLSQQPRETYRPVPEYRPRPAPVYRPAPAYGARQSQAHVDWCANRYRSYDFRSNTFQPYNGPRQTCYSPYS